MRNIALFALFAAGFAVSVPAALTTGFEAGYVTDTQRAFGAGRIGWAFQPSPSLSHQVEIEIGYTEDPKSPSPFNASVPAKLKLTPITLNYRAEFRSTDKLGWYFGAGAGQSRARSSTPASGVPFIIVSATEFTAQAFTGLNYHVTPAATLHAGVKYLWVDDVRVSGRKVDAGNHVVLTAGFSFKF